MEVILAFGIGVFYTIRVILFIMNRTFIKLVELNKVPNRVAFLTIDVSGATFLVLQLRGVIEYPMLDNPVLQVCGVGLFLTGLVVSSWSRIYLGQYWDTAGAGGIKSGHKLITKGPYRFCRHPIYTGTFLLLAGFQLALGSFLILLLIPLALVIFFESKREDAILRSHFEDEYEAYCQKTPRWLPRL